MLSNSIYKKNYVIFQKSDTYVNWTEIDRLDYRITVGMKEKN